MIADELHRRGVRVPLVADIHFTPNAAMIAAEIVEKVRVNPGNYADKKKFAVCEYTDAEYAAELRQVWSRVEALQKVALAGDPVQFHGCCGVKAEFVDRRGVSHISSIDLSKRPFMAQGDTGTTYTADAVILATGAQAKWLGLPSEEQFKGFGVSACATCDGFFYRGKEVVVIGGGNTAVEEALFLTNFASKVTLVHRRDSLRAEKILQKRLFEHPKVEVRWNTTVEEVYGADQPRGVEGVKVRDVTTGEESSIPCDGFFVAIGHAPASELVKDQLETHMGGYVVTKPDSTETSIPGVFAAGDLTDHKYRQAVTSAGMGCMAALEAERFLAEQGDAVVAPEAPVAEVGTPAE